MNMDSGMDKRFIKKGGKERSKGDGVHRQGVDGPVGLTMVPGGEIADMNDPESLLIAQEEREAAEAADKGMTAKQYRDWLNGKGGLDKAA